jgi:hypothetical protein
VLFFVAVPAWSDMILDRAPLFEPFLDSNWVISQILSNSAAPRVEKVLTISGTAPDENKDGFVTDRVSTPATSSIGSADPLGYEVLHSTSHWGNVRIIMDAPTYYRPDSDILPPSGGEGGESASTSDSRPITTFLLPDPASLSLLLLGAIYVLRRRRKQI